MSLVFFNHCISDCVLQALCWTFIHSLWQGLLVATIAGIIISCTQRSKAQVRYNSLVILFAFFLLTVFVTFCLQLSRLSTQKEHDTALTTINAGSAALVPFREGTGPVIIEKEALVIKFTAYCNEHADFVVLIWFLFFIAKCLQILYSLYYIERLRKSQIFPPPEAWNQLTVKLSKTLYIKKNVVLFESRLVNVPLTIGYLKTIILVPVGLLACMPSEQVEAVLLHELAHIRRNDYLVNLLQSFTETLFFFNPAFLWISSLIRVEREACCDDMVLQHMPNKKTYLQALVSFQDYSLKHSGPAMALTHKEGHLLLRIKRMLTQENQKLNSMENTLLVLSIIALTAFGFIPCTETPVVHVIPVTTLVKPNSAVMKDNLLLRNTPTDTIKPVNKGLPERIIPKDTDSYVRKEVEVEADSSEEPYRVVNGRSFVMKDNGWASIDGFTDIIFVDGKRMTPDKVNRTIKRSDIQGVGATGGKDAQKKYGLNQQVLEIFINMDPQTGTVPPSSTKENKALLKEQERKNAELNHFYHQQSMLAVKQEGLQRNKVEKHQAINEVEAEQFRKQSALFEQQAKKFKELQETRNFKEQGRISDSIIHADEH